MMICLLLLTLGVIGFTFSAPIAEPILTQRDLGTWSGTIQPTIPTASPYYHLRPTSRDTIMRAQTVIPAPVAGRDELAIPTSNPHGARPTFTTRDFFSIPVIHHTWPPRMDHPAQTSEPPMDPVFPSLTHSSNWGFPTEPPMDPVFPSLTHSSNWGFPTKGPFKENPKRVRNAGSTTVPPTTASVTSPTTTSNAYPVAAHTGVPDCNFQALPSTTILNSMIHDTYAPTAWSCQETCEAWTGCRSYSYRLPTNSEFPNCELFSVEFDGVDPATGGPLVIKWLVPLMWFSNSRPSDGSGYCYAKP